MTEQEQDTYISPEDLEQAAITLTQIASNYHVDSPQWSNLVETGRLIRVEVRAQHNEHWHIDWVHFAVDEKLPADDGHEDDAGNEPARPASEESE